jgi:hypothetical protein
MSRRRDDIRPIPAIQKFFTGDEFKNYIWHIANSIIGLAKVKNYTNKILK